MWTAWLRRKFAVIFRRALTWGVRCGIMEAVNESGRGPGGMPGTDFLILKRLGGLS